MSRYRRSAQRRRSACYRVLVQRKLLWRCECRPVPLSIDGLNTPLIIAVGLRRLRNLPLNGHAVVSGPRYCSSTGCQIGAARQAELISMQEVQIVLNGALFIVGCWIPRQGDCRRTYGCLKV